MKLAQAGSPQAWQPFTPPGVAAFAATPSRRLMLVMLVFAALAGISVTIFLSSAWFPTISEATRKLPETGYIRGGHLAWTGKSPTLLANSLWLAVSVDLEQDHPCRPPCDLQVEFSSESVRLLSLFGYIDLRYPRGWIIVFNEPELGAWWKAWEPFLAAGAGLVTAIGLLFVWALLGAVYAVPTRAICRFVEHDLSYGAVWRLCCAAQMPGALLMAFTLLLYSLRAADLVQLLFVTGAHLVVSWIYILLATLFVPGRKATAPRKSNPFGRR